MQTLQRLLVVDDNPRFAAAAQRYLGKLNVTVTYVNDYVSAVNELSRYGSDSGLISDVLFPYRASSSDTELGRRTIYKMMREDVREQHAQSLMRGLAKHGVDTMNDAEMQSLVRAWRRQSPRRNRRPIMDEVVALNERGFSTTEHLRTLLRRKFGQYRDGYAALLRAVDDGAHNQPLCIPLGEQADRMGIPFVIATSTNYKNPVTKPVFDYVGRMHRDYVQHGDPAKWLIVSCERGYDGLKRKDKFWYRANNALSMQLPRKHAPNGRRHLVTVSS